MTHYIDTINEKSLDIDIEITLKTLKNESEAPEWMTVNGLRTLIGGYLLPGETPKAMYRRVCNAAAKRLGRADLEARFFDIIWHGYLGLSTPIAANMGAERGLPISCFASLVPDTINGIFDTIKEVACMSAKGGGTSMYFGEIRAKGSHITGGGTSNGVVPWVKVSNESIKSVTQANVRRGALAWYLPIEHDDFFDAIKTVRPTSPDYCEKLQLGVCISDAFMLRLRDKDEDAMLRWKELMTARWNHGKVYIFFTDTVNKLRPQCYKDLGLTVKQSNLCTEILLFTDYLHSLICCLASLNVALYDTWPEDLVELAIYFLDAVMEEFIVKASEFEGFERALRSAIKGRAVGLGVIGFHSYLQDHMIAFGSDDASEFNKALFKRMREEADAATAKLADQYGEPEWCKGYGRRATHTLAIAPTVSNSLISGEVSPGIEPITSALFIKDRGNKGSLIRYNNSLKRYFASIGRDTEETWQEIKDEAKKHESDDYSVQHLDWLSQEAKEVFKTAREIDQLHLIKHAAERQPYLDQTQSLNLFFKLDVDQGYFQRVHLEAYKQGVPTLYYCRSEKEKKIGVIIPQQAECALPTAPPVVEDEPICIPCQG